MPAQPSHSNPRGPSQERPPPEILVVVELIGAGLSLPELEPSEPEASFSASRAQHVETLSGLIQTNETLATHLGLSARLERLKRASEPHREEYSVDRVALEKALEALPVQEMKLAFNQLIDEIDHGSHYFDYLKELGLFDALKQGFTEPALGMRFEFSGTEELLVRGKALPPHVAAAYHPGSHTACFRGSPPLATNLWAQLATNGALPELIEHIHHEHVRGLQRVRIPPTWLLKHAGLGGAILAAGGATLAGASLLGTFVAALSTTLLVDHLVTRYLRGKDRTFGPVPRALRELQAYLAMEESPSAFRAPRTPVEHIGHISAQITSETAQFMSNPLDDTIPLTFSRVATAVTGAGGTFQALRALGVSHQELGELLRSPRYDPTTASFPQLEMKLSSLRAELGLSDDREFTKFMRAIRFERAVSWTTAREQAKQLARQALKSFGVTLPIKAPEPEDNVMNG